MGGLGIALSTLKTTNVSEWRLGDKDSCGAVARLHPADDIVEVSQQILGQNQPQPGFALHRLVHVDVNVYRPVALRAVTTGKKRFLFQILFFDELLKNRRELLLLTPVLAVTRAFLALSPIPETIC